MTTPRRFILSLILVLSLIGIAGHCTANGEYDTRFTEAVRATTRGIHSEALSRWKQLLADFPQAPYTDLALLRVAQCYSAASQWKQLAESLTTLRTSYPHSPYRPEATVLLFAATLELKQLTEADALWTEIFTEWPHSAYMFRMTCLFFQSAHIASPEHATEKLRQILAQGYCQSELTQVMYAPLADAKRVDALLAVHMQCQSLLKASNAPDEQFSLEDAAFHDSITKEVVEEVFTRFHRALDAKDRLTAQHWLATINIFASAHPRAVEARKLFREAEQNGVKTQ